MLSFEQAGKLLDEAVEALPEGIFDDLNGGVNLIPGEKRDEDGNYIMGLYHHDEMGRWIEIFYGSFAALYAGADDETAADELIKTLHHELTHHVENKAGDRTLEHWDEEQKLLWARERELEEKPLEADSVLFVDEDGVLAGEAEEHFLLMGSLQGLDVDCGSAPLARVDAALLEKYDAVMCMTLAQADALAERFPAFDERILCLGETDLTPPKHKGGWGNVRRHLKREVQYLVDELSGREPDWKK